METNLLNFLKAKNEKSVKRTEDKFKDYLSLLKQEELQYEANFLMNKINSGLDSEGLRKTALLMDELSKRVSVSDMSKTIDGFAKEIRDQIE